MKTHDDITPDSKPPLAPGLYLVATPIGNLGDLSDRAKDVLHRCDAILAEDTRHTQKILQHIGAHKPLVSCHEHNEIHRIAKALDEIRAGKVLALVTNAGMPTVSDPGFRLAREAAAQGLLVQALPGPCAAVTALAVSGLPPDRFIFEGFFPRKPGKAKKFAQSWLEEVRTVIFYESPQRIDRTLRLLQEVLGNRQVVICRELTKTFEEIIRGDLQTLVSEATPRNWRGEITVVLAGCGKSKKSGKDDDDPEEDLLG